MASGLGDTYDDDHAVLDDDFLNDGRARDSLVRPDQRKS